MEFNIEQLTEFIQEFPFNAQHWIQFTEIYAKQNEYEKVIQM